MNKKNRKKGFTLVELIVVIAILAILAVIAVPTTIAVLDKGKDQAANTELNEGLNALVNHIALNGKEDIFISKTKLETDFPALLVEVGVANSIQTYDIIYDIEEVKGEAASATGEEVKGYKYAVSIKVTSVRDSKGMHKAVKPITKKVTTFETVEEGATVLATIFPGFTAQKGQTITFTVTGAAEQSGALTDSSKAKITNWTGKTA